MAFVRSAVLELVGPLRAAALASNPFVSPRRAAPVARAARYTCSVSRPESPARSSEAPVVLVAAAGSV
jgi:hypothetical protein